MFAKKLTIALVKLTMGIRRGTKRAAKVTATFFKALSALAHRNIRLMLSGLANNENSRPAWPASGVSAIQQYVL